MRNRFPERVTIDALLAGPHTEFHRLRCIAAVCVVMRQFDHAIVETLCVHRLKGGRDSFVQQLAALDQHRIVGDIAGQRVFEAAAASMIRL
jgi:hypothetical protein